MAFGISLNVFIRNVGWVESIDGVVCQVHVHILFIEFGWLFVRMGGQPSQPFLEPKYLKRIKTFNEDINT